MIKLPPIPTGDSKLVQSIRTLRAGLSRTSQNITSEGGYSQTPRGTFQTPTKHAHHDAEAPFFPFMVYGNAYGSTDVSTDWLRVHVRGGNVGTIIATGTDGAEYPYANEEALTPPASFLLTAAYPYWKIYLEMTFSGAGIITAAEVKSAAEGWTGYPAAVDTTASKAYIVIATVDTSTFATDEQIEIQQIIVGHLPPLRVFQICSGQYALMPCWI